MRTFLILFLLAGFICKAQMPYELFNSKSEYFYKNSSSSSFYLKGLKPDSVKVSGSDSIYYHYRVYYMENSPFCINANSPSWLGKRTLRKSNGDYLFFTKNNDTLTIKTQAPMGYQWIYYRYSNGNYIRATLANISYVTINGLSDTVKSVIFQAFNSNNNAIYHYYNSKTFRFGKTIGLFVWGNLYNFPADSTYNTRCYGKRLKNKDIYDKAVGDVVQSYATTNNYNPSSPFVNTAYYNDSIVSKTYITPDSISLTNTKGVTKYFGSLNKYAVIQMPEQSRVDSLTTNFFEAKPVNYELNGNGVCQKIIIDYLNYYCGRIKNAPTDTCFNNASVSCNYAELRFVEGVGYFFNELFMGLYTPRTHRGYTFAQINNVVCGSFVTNLDEIININSLKIFPNPAAEYFMIEGKASSIFELQIFEVTGKLIMNRAVAGEEKVEISTLNPGIYFVCLKGADTQYNFKLIKQ